MLGQKTNFHLKGFQASSDDEELSINPVQPNIVDEIEAEGDDSEEDKDQDQDEGEDEGKSEGEGEGAGTTEVPHFTILGKPLCIANIWINLFIYLRPIISCCCPEHSASWFFTWKTTCHSTICWRRIQCH